MINADIICILGRAGLRMDFVAGWLGTLPNYIKSEWYLDPVTRQSRAVTSNVIDLRQDFNLAESVSACCNFNLLSGSGTHYATKAHRIHKCHWHHVESGAIKLLKIVPNTDIDQAQVQWEFFLKTYGKLEHNGTWGIDRLIPEQNVTRNDRIEKLHELLLNRKDHNVFQADHNDVDIPELLYSKLFAPGGSVYLCDVLEQSVEIDFHNFWDAMVPLAHTPPVVTLWGKQWRLDDYIN